MASSLPVKLGSAIAACALAAGVSTTAGAATNFGFGRVNAQPPSGASRMRHQAKAAAVTAFTTLYSFSGIDGAQPSGELLEDLHGNLYGTTQAGGPNFDGTVFRYSNGTVTNLHTFTGPDGASPAGGLLNSIGNLDIGGNVYGVTSGGGYKNRGVVYSINTATGAFTILHAFKGGLDGYAPFSHLVLFTDGNLYGTTSMGGGYNKGLVFRITPKGVYSVVACFTGKNGSMPIGGLSLSLKGFSVNGALFGTTSAGGAYGAGTVFSVTPQGKITNLHSLNPATDGASPNGALIPDDNGNLYGTAYLGGSGSAGTIFEESASGKFTTLYAFPTDPATQLNPNGAQPLARLASFLNGNLYGTTAFGGPTGGGVVFEFNKGALTVLHSFDGTDGATPIGQLLLSPDGNIYGTTSGGGAGAAGTLFALPFSH